jgi:hypothetical protein
LDVCLNPASEASTQVDNPTLDRPAASNSPFTITLPWTAPSFAAVKGIIHEPREKPGMKPESRDGLLTAIAKTRKWIDDIRLGHFASFAEIAEREAVGERQIRLLAPLAFLSPRIIAAIVDGRAPGGHRPRQSPALFMGRARAEVRPPFQRRLIPATLIHWAQWRHAIAPRTDLCRQSNPSAIPGTGNWKKASRDRRPKPASNGQKCRKLLTRDRGLPPNPLECGRFPILGKTHR